FSSIEKAVLAPFCVPGTLVKSVVYEDVCTPHICSVHGGQKVSALPELELPMVVNCHVKAVNQLCVLWTSNWCFSEPSHLCSNHRKSLASARTSSTILNRNVPCIPTLSKAFIMKGCWILSNAFSASNEMIMCCYSSNFISDFINFDALSLPFEKVPWGAEKKFPSGRSVYWLESSF
ncbi:hypothetical protein STEG23_035712, partial [Scotinomys teguina]